MWRRVRNGANPGMVPPWARGSSSRGMGSISNRGRTHGRTALSGGKGGDRGRHGGGDDRGG